MTRNKMANLMVLSDSTGSERALQEMEFKILKYGKHI